jgi:hypothetical protein
MCFPGRFFRATCWLGAAGAGFGLIAGSNNDLRFFGDGLYCSLSGVPPHHTGQIKVIWGQGIGGIFGRFFPLSQ